MIATHSAPERLTYSGALTLVTKTIADTDRRKRNVIVSGLPESNSSDGDVTAFSDLCRSALHIEVHNDIVLTKRLGNPDPIKKRRLLVVFNLQSIASNVYSHARLLRHSGDQYTDDNIFIKPRPDT